MAEGYTLTHDGGVATLTVDRPAQRNALDVPLVEDLTATLSTLDAGVRALILTGGGEKSFIAGADINDLLAYSPEQARRHIEVGHRLFSLIEELPIPTVAAINGYCLGGGLEIAMACDIRLASANARFGQPEVKIGMPCGWGGTERLQRLIGQSRAKYLMLTGAMLDAEAALASGLVAEVLPDVTALRARASELGAELAGYSPLVLRATKQMIADAHGATAREVAHRDELALAYLMTTADAKEGLTAFLEKRPAVYRGL